MRGGERRAAAGHRTAVFFFVFFVVFSLTGGIMLHTLERGSVPSQGLIHYLLLTRGKSPALLRLLVRSNRRNGVLARSRSSPGVSGSRGAKPPSLIFNENTLCLCTQPPAVYKSCEILAVPRSDTKNPPKTSLFRLCSCILLIRPATR